MAILAGIDEAGLGPLLGPLVVSAVSFRIPDDRADQCLWATLRRSCAPSPGRRERRLVIADSKTVFRSDAGPAALERAVLVILSALGPRPGTWRGLLTQVAPEAVGQLDEYPWSLGVDFPLPAFEGVGDLPTLLNAFRTDARDHAVGIDAVFCEPLHPARFNRLVERTRNKAVVALGQTLRTLDRVLRGAGDETIVRVDVDRQGGRMRYREPLMTAFPDFDLQIVTETDERSGYRLTRGAQVCHVEFAVAAEQRHFTVALASMVSKYLRELDMLAFNRYWSERVAGLRPTAGYYTDARRWLRDAGGELRRRGIDQRILVRVR